MMGKTKLRDEIVFNLDQRFLDSANSILSYTETSNLEFPAIFRGIKEEDEAIRFEWTEVGRHSVLVIDEDGSFYGFHLDLNTKEEASFHGNLLEAMSFLNTYIKNGERI